MVAESARSPTISSTGSPGATYSRRNVTTSTPANVGTARASRRAKNTAVSAQASLSTGISAKLHVGPPLGVEHHGNLKSGDPWLHGVQFVVEKQVNHRRVAKLDLVRLPVKCPAAGLVGLGGGSADEPGEFRVGVKRDVAS